MATHEEVKKELTAEFGPTRVIDYKIVPCKEIKDSPYFTSFVEIGVTLSNTKLVHEGLQALEKDLLQVLEDQINQGNNNNGKSESSAQLAIDHFKKRAQQFTAFTDNEYVKMFGALPEKVLDYPEDNDPRFSKLLTTALRKTEKEAGFADEVDYIFSGLDSTPFLENLKTRRPFKDYGASPNHGAYTHRLQWYVLAKMFKGNTAELYAAIADWSEGSSQGHPKIGGQAILWNHLCDRGTNTGFGQFVSGDYRWPNALLSDIVKEDTKTPLLSAFLQVRKAKRPGATRYEQNLDAFRMAALKLFRRSYDRLSNTERDAADKLAQTGIVSAIDLVALVKK